MTIRHIADAAFNFTYSITHDWRCAEKSVEIVYNNSDEQSITALNEKVIQKKQELFRQFLQNKLGYVPSDQVITFIKEFRL